MRSVLLDAGPQTALSSMKTNITPITISLYLCCLLFGSRLITTWPYVVEASCLLGIPQRYELLRWIELGGVVVYPFNPHNMDFTDATLY